jgi:predicted nucleic acid-binding protein
MPGKFLFDTNIVIEILNNKELKFSEEQLGIIFFISIITELELFSNGNLTAVEENQIKELLSNTFIINIDEKVKEKTIFIRKKYNLKLPDAIIAASAAAMQIPLVSNDKIFDKFTEVEVLTLTEFLRKELPAQ